MRVFYRLHDASWIQNVVVGIALWLVFTAVALYMKSPQAIIYGGAIGLTILLWVFAIFLAREFKTVADATPAPVLPLVLNPSDLPPPPAAPPVPETKETAPSAPTQTASDAAHNINGDQINITAPNNSGTVIGKQTIVSPTGRHLSSEQKSILEAAFLQFAGTKNLRVMVRMGDPEAYAYAQEISNCLPVNSRTSLLQSMGKNLPGIIGIAVRNPDKPPACAEDVVNAFRTASIPVKKMFERSIPDENTIWVLVFFNQ